MMEMIDTLPDINVQPAEYKRLLGYPRDHALSGRARDLAEQARAWYAANGRPWVYARHAAEFALHNGSIRIDGDSFTSPRLRQTLATADAGGVVLAAVSAGVELEREAQRLWRDEKPDEYFFLEIFGSAVVEHLVTTLGARLCAWAEGRGMAVLPHYSPGYPEWDIAQQPRLLEVIRRNPHTLPGELEALDSGMLTPKKSLLAVFGITQATDRVRRLTDLIPCQNCSLAPCPYRRAPYARAAALAQADGVVGPDEQAAAIVEIDPLDAPAKYATNIKALRRWAGERLSLQRQHDGTIDALFRYEGTTCSNTGRALHFDYHVKLGPRDEGYVIRDMRCAPAPGDDGYTFMCRYMNNAEHLMVAIDREKPLLGQRLSDVLAWQRPLTAPSCYCEPASRKHKWGIVLETIHYALASGAGADHAGLDSTERKERGLTMPAASAP